MMDYLLGLDLSIYRALNDLCGSSPVLDRLAVHGSSLSGALFMGIVGALWFSPHKEAIRQRETIVIILLAVALSLVINRGLSTLLPFRYRPMYSVATHSPSFEWRGDLENWSSFPSDNATYLFAIAAGFWLVSWRVGLLFAAFAAFVAIARVFLGIHYPSDILVGAAIGVATTLAVNRNAVRKIVGGRVLALEPRYPAWFYCLFFVALAEVSGGFPVTRHIGVAVVHLFVPYEGARSHR